MPAVTPSIRACFVLQTSSNRVSRCESSSSWPSKPYNLTASEGPHGSLRYVRVFRRCMPHHCKACFSFADAGDQMLGRKLGETLCKCPGGQIQAHVRVSNNVDKVEVCFRLGKVLLAESPPDVVERT